MIIEYIDSIFCENIDEICDLSNDEILNNLCSNKIGENEYNENNILYYFSRINNIVFELCNGTFTKKNYSQSSIKKIYEWDIFVNQNELIYIKTPIVKCIKQEYPYYTFEILYPYDNYQVKIFEKIINYIQYCVIHKSNIKNVQFERCIEPLIHRSYEKKFFTIKYTKDFSRCFTRYNQIVDLDCDNHFINTNDEYILSLALQKKLYDKDNNCMSCEWNISEIKSLKYNDNKSFSIIKTMSNDCINHNICIPPIPPPLPPKLDNNKHKIVIQKHLVLDKIKKDLPIEKMIAPSLNEIQSILNKMKKKNS